MENTGVNIKEKWDQYREDGQIEFITFHPSYSYEEFIEGITVNTDGENIPTIQNIDNIDEMLNEILNNE